MRSTLHCYALPVWQEFVCLCAPYMHERTTHMQVLYIVIALLDMKHPFEEIPGWHAKHNQQFREKQSVNYSSVLV